jgi:hypothetical protein
MWFLASIAVVIAMLTAVSVAPRWRKAPFADFSNIQTGAQCLIAGCDPYDSVALNGEAARRHDAKGEMWEMSPVYPPSALILALTYEALPWPLAAHLFDLTGGLLAAGCAGLMVWRFRIRLWDPAALIVLGLVISEAVQGALDYGNPALLEAALAGLGCLFVIRGERRSFDFAGCVALGVALALKPQLAVGVIIVLLLWRETRMAGIRACGIALALLLIGLLSYRLRLGSFHYLSTLHHAFSLSVAPLASSDFASNFSFDFLNIQTSFATIHHLGRRSINLLAWLTAALLAALAIALARRSGALRYRPWTMIALGQIICLLPIYHRGYDRVIALLLIPAAVELAATRRWIAWVYAACVALWLTNEKVMTYVMTKLRFQPINPVVEVAVVLVLLGSLVAVAGKPAESSSIVE